jgi:hypothetical protein
MPRPELVNPGTRTAVEDLAHRDPQLPMLPLLLDDAALSRWLSSRLARDVEVSRRYLRYKPGTGCVVAGDLLDGGIRRDIVVSGHSASAVVKAEKTVAKAPPGAVLAWDPQRHLVATTPAADRKLPALRMLADLQLRLRLAGRLLGRRGHHDPGRLTLDRLSYKPLRRWVGTLRDDAERLYVLRCYATADVRAAMRAHERMADAPVVRQRLLAQDAGHGLIVLDFVPGATLVKDHTEVLLRDLGRALAGLHRHPASLPPTDPAGERLALRQAARQVRTLLPALTPAVGAVVESITARLDGCSEPVTLHGDFSLDQVVAGPDGLTFIDFDRATTGPREADLGSLAAAALVLDPDRAEQMTVEVLRGYADAHVGPDPGALATQTAAHLLRRAAEPFRSCRTDWPADAARIVETAAAVLDTTPATPRGGHDARL